MKKAFLCVLGFATAVAANSAMAADLPITKAAGYAPSPSYDWTGCYVGAQGGGIAGFPTYSGTVGAAAVLGGQIGCNYQMARFGLDHVIFGIEGEAFWSNLNAKSDTAFSSTAFSNTSTKNPWTADVGVRVGYAWDNVMFFGKVGAAFSRFNFSTNSNFGLPSSETGSATFPGALMGLGLELAFTPQWSGKIELDTIYFNSQNVTFADSPGGARVLSEFSVDVVGKIGIDYKFSQ
jgi:outer membrane immunogenic protein